MKKTAALVILLLGVMSFSAVFANEEHHDEEQEGITLSPEAIKNFELKAVILTGTGPWEIPVSAILNSGEEVNIYRVRNGFYKRIDFNLISKTGQQMKIRSQELTQGDAVVITGVGFLRTAEITALGGAPEGHSH